MLQSNKEQKKFICLGKRPSGMCLVGEYVRRGSVRRESVRRGSVWSGKCPSEKCPSGKCPSGKCPSGKCLVRKMSVGDFSVGNLTVGEVSFGDMSLGKMSVGELSGHRIQDPAKYLRWSFFRKLLLGSKPRFPRTSKTRINTSLSISFAAFSTS